MRAALAIVMATFTLGLAPRLMHAQMQAADAPAMETIHMVDRQTGWAVAEGVLLRTTDGGTNWRDVTPLSSTGQKIYVFKVTVLSPHIAWVIAAGAVGTNTTGIFRTIDGGSTWTSTTIPTPSVTSISFVNPREGWLLASLGAASAKEVVEIYRSTDRGETWSAVARSMPDDTNSGLPFQGDKSSITFVNPTTGWIMGVDLQYDSLYLYVTRDGGRTWRRQNLSLPPQLTSHWMAYPQPPKFFTARDGILLVDYHQYRFNDSTGDIQETGEVFVLYATHDSGTTWMYTAPVPVSVSKVVHHAVADMNHAWMKQGNALYVTSDGGRRWTTMHPDQFFADVTQLDFISPQVGWAIRRTFPYGGGISTPPFLLKTLDGGRTWSPVTYTISRQ